jgi:DNA-binding NarL/FixJ family response regulator
MRVKTCCRVLLAEDFPAVRQTLHRLIKADAAFEVVAEAEHGEAALALAAELQPDLLVTDLMMPGMNGLEVMRRVHESSPHTRMVVVSIHQDEPYVVEAFRCGARAYVHKEALALHLLEALHAVLNDRLYVSPPLALPPARRDVSDAAGPLDVWESLTGRELRVLRLAALNESELVLARHLAINHSAATLLLQNLMRKLGAGNRAELLQLARAHGAL